jgi:hypothetical protein
MATDYVKLYRRMIDGRMRNLSSCFESSLRVPAGNAMLSRAEANSEMSDARRLKPTASCH